MKIGNYDVPLGMSIANYKPEDVKKFIDAGFTHFELYIKPRMPDPNPLAKSPAERRKHPYTYDEAYKLTCRGEEEKLVALTAPIGDAVIENGLCLWSIHLPFGGGWDIAHYEERDRESAIFGLKRIMDLTAKWNPKVFVVHGCLEPVTDEERPIRVAHCIQSLIELEAYAKKFGAHIAVEDLPRSCLGNTSKEIRAISAAAGVSVCFDVNHLLYDNQDDFLDILDHNIITTHISDYDGIDERHWLPGEGIINWKNLYERMQKAGYRGPYLFELKVGENGPYSPEKIKEAFINSIEN